MVFQIYSLSNLGLVFCSVNENSLNCRSGLVLLCFLFRDLYQEFCSFVHAISIELLARRQFSICVANFLHSRE